MTRNPRAVIYTRISKDSEERGEGNARQEDDCRRLAERLGYDVVSVFPEYDTGASTASKKARPKYNAMVSAVKAGGIDVVLAYSLSRLTRQVREFLDLIDLHSQTGALIRTCVSGDPDLTTADGRATALTLATWDQAEAERTAERVRRAALQKAEQGHYTGKRPFGYQFATDDEGRVLTGSEKRLVVDPDEAAVIRECVRRVLSSEGLWSICKDLNRRGITTSTGARWQTQPLRRMLMRWTHAGYRKHQEFRNGKYIGQEHLYEAVWEAIIDRETHERVIAKLTDPARVSNKGDTALKYLLTWLVSCGACGQPMVGTKEYEYTVKGYQRVDGTRSPSRKRVYPAAYKCQHAGCMAVSRRMDVVDEFVEHSVVALLEAEGVEVLGGDQQAVTEAQERIEAIKARRSRLSDLALVPVEEGGLDDEQFRRQNAKLAADLKTEQDRLSAARPAEGFDEFTSKKASTVWADASVTRKRAVILALMQMTGLTISVDPVGSGVFSDSEASPYIGIRIDWDGG